MQSWGGLDWSVCRKAIFWNAGLYLEPQIISHKAGKKYDTWLFWNNCINSNIVLAWVSSPLIFKSKGKWFILRWRFQWQKDRRNPGWSKEPNGGRNASTKWGESPWGQFKTDASILSLATRAETITQADFKTVAFFPASFISSSFINWLARVQQTVSASPGTVRRAQRRCVRPPPPREAPPGAGSVHTAPGRERSRWPHPRYHGSTGPERLLWKSCRCLEAKKEKEIIQIRRNKDQNSIQVQNNWTSHTDKHFVT